MPFSWKPCTRPWSRTTLGGLSEQQLLTRTNPKAAVVIARHTPRSRKLRKKPIMLSKKWCCDADQIETDTANVLRIVRKVSGMVKVG